ncbi:HNH endonuclease signature motif containing protein [Roseomonas gilardii]|uniref:HNH endonuclease n=1 Tax=Roseomonas gilardii TaxID=257708 RepID=UPI001C92DB76
MTGLQLINGGGKAEAQAAHILPVAVRDPDVVQNGIALSAMVHWLFHRVSSRSPRSRLLVSHNRVSAELRGLFQKQVDRINLPKSPQLWPCQPHVQRYRELFATG